MNRRHQQAPQRSYRFPWQIVVAVGIIAMLAGIGLLLWPWAPVQLLVIIFGVGLIANGLSMLVRNESGIETVLGGIALLIAGVLVMVFNRFTSGMLVTLAGIGLIVIAVFWFLGARKMPPNDSRQLLLLQSMIAFTVGVATLIWPALMVEVVAVALGGVTLVIGIMQVIIGFRMRNLTAESRAMNR